MNATAPPPAACVPPTRSMAPWPLPAAIWRLRAAFARLQRRRRVARMWRALAALDDATLRDIGMTHAEAGSMAAEMHGAAECTRVRTLGRSVARDWS